MRLSVQLYTVRDALASDLKGTLGTLHDIGLEYVELAGMYDRSAEEWRDLLDTLGLKASGSHVMHSAIESDFEGVVATAKTLGYDAVIVPWVGDDVRSGGYSKFGEALAKSASKLQAEGLTLGYHNHDFEFVEEGDTLGLDALFNAAGGALRAELDLAWVKIGGQDPLDYIARYGKNACALHLKDFDPDASPRWVPAGKGVVGIEACVKAGLEAGTPFGVIELDEFSGDPMDAVQESYDYLSSLGLK